PSKILLLYLHDALPIWNFGDGVTSTLQNPNHTYSKSGSFNVCLKIVNSLGNCSDSICQTVYTWCKASFSYSADTSNPNLINFTRSEEHTSELQSRVDLV